MQALEIIPADKNLTFVIHFNRKRLYLLYYKRNTFLFFKVLFSSKALHWDQDHFSYAWEIGWFVNSTKNFEFLI